MTSALWKAESDHFHLHSQDYFPLLPIVGESCSLSFFTKLYPNLRTTDRQDDTRHPRCLQTAATDTLDD